MSKSRRGYSSVPESVRRYKMMLKTQERTYFDLSEFEEIIEYFLERGLIEKAEEALAHAQKTYPNSKEIYLKEAQVMVEKKDFVATENILSELHPQMNGEADFYFLYGYMYAVKEEFEKADLFFTKFIKLSSNSNKADAYSSAAFVYVQTGDYETALKYLKNGEKHYPESSYILYDSAFCHEKTGNYSESIRYYEKYLKDHPFSANVWYNLAVVYNLNAQAEKAIEAYDFALALDPKFLAASLNKAHTELNTGKYANALKSYEHFLKYKPESGEALSGLGDCYRFMADYDQATEYYRKALKEDKYSAHALYGIALVYYEKEYNFDGLNFVLRALKRDKLNASYHFLAALFFDRLGYVDKAEQSFITSVENNPFSVQVWIAFSDLFVEKETEKAITILKEAGSLLPNAGQIYYRLAVIFYQLKQWDESEAYLQKALSDQPDYLEQFLEEYPGIAQNEQLKKLIDTFIIDNR
jgi:tetratricopeptide (TPR) repeat protein